MTVAPWLICLLGAGQLADRAPADAIAWAHVPRLPEAVRQVRASPLAGVLEMFAPARTLDALGAQAAGEALLTVGVGTESSPTWRVALAAGALAPKLAERLRASLTAQGFREGAPEKAGPWTVARWDGAGTSLVAFEGDGSFGLASDAQTARASGGLSTTDPFVRMARSGDPAYGRLDIKRLYGRLARGPKAAALAGNLARVGVLAAEAVTWRARMDARGAVRARAFVALPGEATGVLGALGEPHAALDTAGVSRDVLSVMRMSVRPSALLYALNRLFSYNRPIEYGLWQAQLGAVEQGVAKRLDVHALGDEPRLWTVYRLRGGRRSVVLEAEVADGHAARAIARGLVASLPSVAPTARVTEKKIAGREALILGGSLRGALAFDSDRVWLGSDEGSLARALSRKVRIPRGSGPPVLISGYLRELPEALARVTGRKRVEGVDHVGWAMTRAKGGYEVEAVVVGRK